MIGRTYRRIFCCWAKGLSSAAAGMFFIISWRWVVKVVADIRMMRMTVTICVATLPLAPRKVLRSEEHTSELQSRQYLVCRLLLEKKNGEAPRRVAEVMHDLGLVPAPHRPPPSPRSRTSRTRLSPLISATHSDDSNRGSRRRPSTT